MKPLISMLLVVITLFGCASIESPPKHWPSPIMSQTDGCPNLSGSYSNDGEGVDEGHSGGPLATHIFPHASKNWTKSDVETRERFSNASHITFYGPNKSGLVVEAWEGKVLIGRVERQENVAGGYRCDAGALLVSLPVYAQAFDGVFFDAFRNVKIIPAQNGHITVMFGSTSFGLGFYFIPVAMRFESWALYPSVDLTDIE